MKRQLICSSIDLNLQPVNKRFRLIDPLTETFDPATEQEIPFENRSIEENLTLLEDNVNNVQHEDEIVEIEILEETHPIDPILVEDSDEDVADELIDVVTVEPSSNIPMNSNDDLEIIEEIYPPVNVSVTSNLIDLTVDESDNHSTDFERHSSIDSQECPICLETFNVLQSSGTYLMITACRHVFCSRCIRQLLANYSQCPLCRENLNLSSLMPYCILT